MSDPLADSTARLEQPLRQLVAEKDVDKADPLVEEVWKILAERDRIRQPIATDIKGPDPRLRIGRADEMQRALTWFAMMPSRCTQSSESPSPVGKF